MSNMGARPPESDLDQQKLPSLLLGIGGRGKRGFKFFSKLSRPILKVSIDFRDETPRAPVAILRSFGLRRYDQICFPIFLSYQQISKICLLPESLNSGFG
jgi:hypothetical protein